VKRLLIGIAAALALGVAPVVAAHPAALASSVHVCTAYGKNFCLGASSLTDGTPITNSSDGRDIIVQDQHFTSGGLEVYRLAFALDTSKCVGFSANGLAEVRNCNGNTNFTNWQNFRQSDGTTVWANNSFNPSNCTTSNDQGRGLTSDNKLGDRVACSGDLISGDLVKWTPSPTP
jgi:hypothetical protein